MYCKETHGMHYGVYYCREYSTWCVLLCIYCKYLGTLRHVLRHGVRGVCCGIHYGMYYGVYYGVQHVCYERYTTACTTARSTWRVCCGIHYGMYYGTEYVACAMYCRDTHYC